MARQEKTRLRDVIAGLVACAGLAAVTLIVFLCVTELPDQDKGANVVTIGSTALGVVSPIIGAYFGIRGAGNAVEQVRRSR